MSRRSLLSVEPRARLFEIPTTLAETARHYVLSPEDLLLVRAKRRSMNRLGFAVQLCFRQYDGAVLDAAGARADRAGASRVPRGPVFREGRRSERD